MPGEFLMTISLRALVLASFAPFLFGNCMKAPRLNADNMTCTNDDNCLVGYHCVAGACRKAGADVDARDALGNDDVVVSPGLDVAADSPMQDVAPLRADGARNGDGAGPADSGTTDAPIIGAGDVGLPETGAGGTPGTGGIGTGGGGAPGTGGIVGGTGGAGAGGAGGALGTGGIGAGGATTTVVNDCGLPPDPLHGSVSLTSTTVGAVATYSCATGYQLAGTAKRTCQADGTWSASAPTCVIVDCGPLASPANGIVSALTTTYDSKATYQCGGKYQRVGVETRTCQADGTWSDTAPTCKCIAMCGSTCVDLFIDQNNCGACGNVCATTAPSEALSCSGVCIIKLIPPIPNAFVQAPSIAVDATSVYVADWDGGTIKKLPLRGGPATTLASGLDRPRGIAVDSTSVYWINYGSSTLMKVALTGGSTTVLASNQTTPGSIVVSGGNLFWPDGGGIMKMAVTGGAVTAIVTGQAAHRLAIDATNIYWTTQGPVTADGAIMKMSQQGGSPTTLVSGRTGAAGIAVDATSVYWTEWNENGSLMKVPLAGGTPVALATFTDHNLPHLVATDGQNVYWTASDGVRKTPASGGETVLIGSKVGNPYEIVVDSKSVYWSTMSTDVTVATPK